MRGRFEPDAATNEEQLSELRSKKISTRAPELENARASHEKRKVITRGRGDGEGYDDYSTNESEY